MLRWTRGALVLALAVPALAAEPLPVGVLALGQFHGDEVDARSGERWLALVAAGDGHVLRECKIQVKVVNDAIVDAEDEATGKEVTAPDLHDEALVLVKAGRGTKLAAGPVVTWQAGGMAVAVDGTVNVGPRGGAPATLALPRGKEDGCRVVLTSGGRTQVLHDSFRCLYVEEGTSGRKVTPSDEQPQVLWAGDMDGDGKLDLLLQMSDHYNMSRVCLYLSTLARSGDLVALAGEHVTVGC